MRAEGGGWRHCEVAESVPDLPIRAAHAPRVKGLTRRLVLPGPVRPVLVLPGLVRPVPLGLTLTRK